MLSILGSRFDDGVFGVLGMDILAIDAFLSNVGDLEKYDFILDEARDNRFLPSGPRRRKSAR